MAFSYWRTGTYPANQGAQGTQRNNGYCCYGDYKQTGWGRAGWNKWVWSGSCLFTREISAAPGNTFQIIDNANTTVTHTGGGVYAITKTSGSGGTYDADAVSSSGITGDFILRLKPITAGIALRYGGGVSASPTGSSNYTTVDNLYLASTTNNWGIYESGANPASGSPGAEFYWIWRTGTTLGYGRGGTLADAQAAADRTTTSTGTMFFDSTFADPGDQLEALFYVSEALAGSSFVTFSQTGALTGAGALAGPSTITILPAGTLAAKGALAGSSTVTFSPAGTLTAKGALAGSPTFTLSPAGTLAGKGALAGPSTVTFAPVGTLGGKGALAGPTTIVLSPAGTLQGSTALTATTTLVFSPAATLAGSGALLGVSTVVFAPVGTLVVPLAQISGSAEFILTISGSLFNSTPIPKAFVIRLGDQGQASSVGRTYGEVSRRGYGSGSARASRSSGGRSYSSARGR